MSRKWTSQEVRKTFLEFFKSKGHKIFPSSSLLPQGDPTLLFTNAGMNQFKPYFLGEQEPPYPRITTVQKCLRAGGKHNDLDNVGFTRRHHTFFEMLGNFSFGDYFKREAIEWAWELLTEVFELPRERLWITVYEEDDEAYEIWRDVIGIPGERIVRMGAKDNFWEMGDVGPCGPSTEIHYDLGPEVDPNQKSLKEEGERFLEIWNIVFMQYNRRADGTLEPLPRKNVDTGMGLERILAVLQGVDSNYHTDLFIPLIKEVERITGVPYSPDEKGAPHRVIADHVRALTFAIADGIYPSNYGRGYVLRRILRRAHRFAQRIGYSDAILYKLVPVVVDIMGDAYPEIREKMEEVQRIIRDEEEKFIRTIGRNLVHLREVIEKSKEKVSGEDVFRLYDTYGIPLDMIEEFASEKGLSVDWEGFYALMEKRRQESQKKSKAKVFAVDKWDWTAEDYTGSKFLGYETLEAKSRIARYRVKDGKVYVVLFETPFYPEGGGQIGDTGIIEGEGFRIRVEDTRRVGQDIVHIGKLEEGEIKPSEVVARVDREKRIATQRAHTATHLLHAALHRILGEHARQQGSLVAPDRLRFDFSHPKALTKEEIRKIEEMVNEKIRENIPVIWEYKKYREAISEGAMAIFEEKYGDVVRVVSIGDFSKELCGGTHAKRTGDLGFFKIVKEESSASGIRRIEAYVGEKALEFVHQLEDRLDETASILKGDRRNLEVRARKLVEERETLEKKYQELLDKYASLLAGSLEKVEGKDGVEIYTASFKGFDMPTLRRIADTIESKSGRYAILLISADGKRVIYHIRLGGVESVDVKEISSRIASILGGKGGGKGRKAEGGGNRPEKIGEAMEEFRKLFS